MSENKYKIKVARDIHAENPLVCWEHGTYFVQCSKYNLSGQESHNTRGSYQMIDVILNLIGGQELVDKRERIVGGLAFLQKYLDKYTIWKPVYMYDHGGQTVSTIPYNCRWDSGQVGYIFVLKTEVRTEYEVQRISPKLNQSMQDRLCCVIDSLDKYLQGETYYYQVQEKSTDEVVSSCHGFLGQYNLATRIHEHCEYYVNLAEVEAAVKT